MTKPAFNLIVSFPSTWSLRAWLVLKLSGLDFTTTPVKLYQPDTPARLRGLSDTLLVPVLHHNGFKVHDSLAIVEYVNELASDRLLYPADRQQRALARSLCAELHSGFVQLRTQHSFFVGPHVQAQPTPPVKNELTRLQTLWDQAKAPFYFEHVGIVDAYYAVMAERLDVYGLELQGNAKHYQQQLLQWPLFQEGMEALQQWQVP